MGKSKRAPALFEVIEPRQLQGGSSRFPLPKWWRGNKASSPNYPPAGQPEPKTADREKIIKLVPQFDRPAAQERVPVPPSTQIQPPPPVTSAVARPEQGHAVGPSDSGSRMAGSRHHAVGLDRGRIQFSLNPISLSVAFGVLLVALIGAYQLGKDKSSVPPKADDLAALQEQEQERDSTVLGAARPAKGDASPPIIRPAAGGSGRATPAAQPNASAGSAKPPAEPPSASTPEADRRAIPTSVRVTGLNYLYIVRFRPEHLDDALHAHKWLSNKGIETAIDEGSDWLSLVSVEGFDLSNPDHKARRLALEAKLKNLSPAYRQDCRSEQRFRYYAFDKPELRKQKD